MNNDSFKNFTNQDYSALGKYLNSINSYEFALIGVIAAFLIAPTMNANEQNSVGNFLEEIGQILLTIAAQEININQKSQGNTTSVGEFDLKHKM